MFNNNNDNKLNGQYTLHERCNRPPMWRWPLLRMLAVFYAEVTAVPPNIIIVAANTTTAIHLNNTH